MSCLALCDEGWLFCCVGPRLLRLPLLEAAPLHPAEPQVRLPEEARRVATCPSGRRAACLLAGPGRVCLVKTDEDDDGVGGQVRCEVLDVVGVGGGGGDGWEGGVAEFAGENRLLVGDREGGVSLFLLEVSIHEYGA